MKNELWDKFLTEEALKIGWHLSRREIRNDFVEDVNAADRFSVDYDNNINEILISLKNCSYTPGPLIHIEVPKGELGFRPGTVIKVRDRIVLYSILWLIAEKIDKTLPESVYSWRVKDPYPENEKKAKNGLFHENDFVLDIPFLKNRTIADRYDVFEPWYETWPEFDKKSRELLDEGFIYMATSDIAAYFENIQLFILRDTLMRHLPEEPKLINFMLKFFESWVNVTHDGYFCQRGIPQGNSISSFLGNIFLSPLDDEIIKFSEKKKGNVFYARYMDDVRIFTKESHDAREAIFIMYRALNKLHLNVQTAKTKIYNEKIKKGITKKIIDSRLKKLDELQESVANDGGDGSKQKDRVLSVLKEIMDDNSCNQKIKGSKTALSDDLTSRVFRRSINLYNKYKDFSYLDLLFRELERNSDAKLLSRLVTASRLSKARKIETFILKFIKNRKVVYPYQIAEMVRCLRYLKNVCEDSFKIAFDYLKNKNGNYYVRIQAANLLTRKELTSEELKTVEDVFKKEPNTQIKISLIRLMLQDKECNYKLIERLILHPNSDICAMAKMYKLYSEQDKLCKNKMKYMFDHDHSWRIIDNIPFLYLWGYWTKDIKIIEKFYSYLKNHKAEYVDLREILKKIKKHVQSKISA